MPLESITHISDLVVTNPVGATDPKSQGDDHLRGIKTALKNDFPNISGAVTLSHTQINNAALKAASNTFTGQVQTISATNPAYVVSEATLNGIMQAVGSDNAVWYGTTSLHAVKLLTNGVTRLTIASNGDTNLGLNSGPVTINSGFDLRNLAAGTYTPTAFNAINCGVTPNKHFYTRVGNIVTVTGRSSINITAGSGTSTSFEISLPIASNFTDATDLAGQGSNDDTGAETIRIQANTGNDRAGVFFSAISTGLGTLFYTFSYEVK